MQIQSSIAYQYSAAIHTTQTAQTAHTNEEVKQAQQQTNNRPAPTNETNKSDPQAGEKNKLADGKAVQQAEQSLDEAELKKVAELKRRDTEVRAHEAAHLAAAGKYATGAASFEYKRGPDGKSYAVGGEVGIDTSPIPNDPQATLRKAQQIQAAAHAPANPSAQDRQVAAQAAVMASEARAEIAQQKTEGNETQAQATEPKSSNKTEASAEENSEQQGTTENQNQKATNEYQSVATYTDDAITPLLQKIA